MTQDPMDFKTYAGASLKALEDVIMERRKQDSQWGGPEHDDTHDVMSWGSYICYQEAKLGGQVTIKEARQRLIKIAALAIAAVESLDRKTK